ncbi:MAG: efflux RND transporter periplasmic adaptor subunit [Gammaproteobacteria bacterium]
MNTIPRRTSRLRWILLLLLVLGLALGIVRALGKRSEQQKQANEAAALMQQEPVFEIGQADVVTVVSTPLLNTVAVSGSLKALQTVQIKARVAGELRDFSRREGETVRAGDVIARIDSADAQARVRQAEQQAAATQAQVAIAQRTQDNNEALVRQGFISATALDTSTANLAAARANHQAALAALDIARKALADTVLRAPLSGQISARLAQNGERLGVDARIAEMVDLSAFEVEVALSPGAATRVAPGQTAQLRIEGLEQAVQARVARINPSVQAGSRSVLLYLQVAPLPGMRQGLFAQGDIITGQQDVAAVPLSAVRNDKPVPYVQVIRDSRVAHVPVQLQRQGLAGEEPMVDVSGQAGLEIGTVVLRSTAGLIREGTAVRTAGSAPQANGQP